VFAVADRPYCCWGFDHKTRSLEFLDGLDSGYFGTLASLCADRLTSEDGLAVSVMLRVGYHQGVETLMSLLGAALQAPWTIPAWIANCSTRDLKGVVVALRDGRPVFTRRGRQRVSFRQLADRVHRYAWTDETGDDSTAAEFGRFWHRLSGEFIDETARAEYNALKHGSRVRAGGFTLAVGMEETPGVPAPEEAMRSMGGSRFGSSFFVSERVGTSKEHIRTRRISVNWSPEALAQRLSLISMSIANVVSALRCELGVDPTSVAFARPVPLTAFDEVWKHEPSISSISMDAVVRIDGEDERSRDELIEILEGLREEPS
jgi:hypothetical protein